MSELPVNIISFSGGKDSTAMLFMMLEKGEHIHSVVWFDTEWEFPEIVEHIEKVKQMIKPIPLWRIRHWIGFDFLEQRLGAPTRAGWCVAAKRDCCNKYIRLMLKDNPKLVECIGYNADERVRANKLKKKWPVRFPLIEWGISKNETLQYCYSKRFDFGGIYEWMPSKRVSCYKCPQKSKADIAAMKQHRPELFFKANP